MMGMGEDRAYPIMVSNTGWGEGWGRSVNTFENVFV